MDFRVAGVGIDIRNLIAALVDGGGMNSKGKAIVVDVCILDVNAEVDVGVVLVVIIGVAETGEISDGGQCWDLVILEFHESFVASPVVIEI